MSIKDFISNAISNFKGKKEKYREMDENYRLERQLQERQLSPNERELIKFREEQRQKYVDAQVGKFRKQKQHEFWHGNKVYVQKPLYKGQNIFIGQKRLFGGKSVNK